MAARPKSKRRQQIEELVLLPVDWLEERSGLVGALRYFLFRKVPRETNWFHTLGSATLTAFLVQAITGVILAMYYKPDPDVAYKSIQHITNDLTLGWLVRGMHRWGASVLLLLMALGEGFTGYLLPWDQTAYWATVVGININASAPIAGPFIADILRGGTEIGPETLSRFYSIHMLLIPGGLAGLIALHLYLVIRLGITPPPWTRTTSRGGGRASTRTRCSTTRS